MALLYGPRDRLLDHDDSEAPVVLQLGGSHPSALAQCAHFGEQAGYSAINLNVGCPSDRVKAGRFGACLMAEPLRVAECVAAMRQSVSIPITVKTRLGIDDFDSYSFLTTFISEVAGAGCDSFIIHARKAWLQGLSPKQNREIPPLNYPLVYQLKKDFPNLHITINGGIETISQANQHLLHVDGVMMGRTIYHDPYLLAESNHHIFNDETALPCRHDIVARWLPYAEKRLCQGRSMQALSCPLLGLFKGQPGAKAWRRYLSEHSHIKGAGIDVIKRALAITPSNTC